MPRRFEIRVTVRSYQLDFLGHVNNSVYFNWLEQARLSLFEELGFSVDALIAGEWLNNVVHVAVDYREPVHFGDRLLIGTRVQRLGRTSVALAHRIERDDANQELVAEARVVVVWLDGEGKPTSLPPRLRERVGDESAE